MRVVNSFRHPLRSVRGLLVLLACCVAFSLAGAPQAWAQKSQQKSKRGIPRSGPVELNFEKVSIPTFLRMMSEALDLALVWDESKIRGEITLISPRAFKRADALSIFESVLALHGYSIVKQDGTPLAQVVPAKEAPRRPSALREQKERSSLRGGRFFQTRIIPLKYIDATAVRSTLAPLMAPTAGLTVHAPANVLLLADSPSGVRRALRIIKALDRPPGEGEFQVLPLQHADASNIASMLGQIAGSSKTSSRSRSRGGGRRRTIVLAETRTNSLVLAGSREEVARLRIIILKLDIPSVERPRGFRVIRLEHANAEEVLKILREVDVRTISKAIGQQGKPEPKRSGSKSKSSSETPFHLTADPATNSLIVFGSEAALTALDGMIRHLDVHQPQVLVEMLIMEVTLEKSLRLGVRWQAGQDFSNGDALGSSGFPDATPRPLAEAVGTGQNALLGVVGDTISFGGESFASFRGFIQATQEDQDLNVLANPQVLTLNNKQAEVNVGAVVPVSTRTVTNTQLQTTTEFEFKDVGVILKITPQITDGNRVRMKIEQETSSIASQEDLSSSEQQRAITTLKRSINTEVLVSNKSTMAIGGLIQNQTVENLTKTPCLGDLWLIGHLFRYRQDETRKTNLIVFIRPTIIRTDEDLRTVTQGLHRRYERSSEAIKDAGVVEETLREAFELPQKKKESAAEEQKQDKAPQAPQKQAPQKQAPQAEGNQ